jgi:hypothetical protein
MGNKNTIDFDKKIRRKAGFLFIFFLLATNKTNLLFFRRLGLTISQLIITPVMQIAISIANNDT